jgi:hypothetical protein
VKKEAALWGSVVLVLSSVLISAFLFLSPDLMSWFFILFLVFISISILFSVLARAKD